MLPGYIPGSRGSFMLDTVAIAMFIVLPALAIGVRKAKFERKFEKHRNIMLSLSVLLLVAVIAFELEMRLIGWRHLAEPSPYYETVVPWLLGIHIVCSVSGTLLLAATVTMALKNFARPPRPGAHSNIHMRIGKATAVALALTSVTGWVFYYLAFIA